MARFAAAWIALVATVAGCRHVDSYLDPEGPRYAGTAEAPRPDPEPGLRVVSYNVEFSRHVEEAVEALRTREPLREADVLLLQEMNAEAVERIASAMGFHYVYYPATERSGGGFGNAVASRWPIVEDHKVILPHPSPANQERRIAVAATIEAPFGRFAVYSVHSETPWLSLRGRVEQLRSLLDDAHQRYAPLRIPVIVGGDMNTPEARGADLLRDLFRRDGFEHATRDVPNTADYFVARVTLDYVFVRGFEVRRAGAEVTDASDHAALHVLMAPTERR
ncbi:MAG TPA: endonuclease/exonuclease/phosphatase family protein [Sandaracinaceae bacterium LLY-WYZ-13_1]|nr:endonuclease/exonuclease/phosphatase family protein [Sandaracinaceae bacterium LLY-WYZ-13_1]